MKAKPTNEKKRLVPWFCMDEWKTVYELVYSDNIDDKKNGLEYLVGWKARCNALPAAVECTLCIIQVLIEDPEHLTEKCVSVAREQQLRLMYSTAVMRFLNLMLHTETDDSAPMYVKATRLNVPDWIVNLRHDAAHGTSLPDLSLLRTGAVFISSWIREQYWESELGRFKDWHVSQDEVKALGSYDEKLCCILEAWEALSLYDLAGFVTMRQIPDASLKSTVNSLKHLLQDDENNLKKVGRAKVKAALSLVLWKLEHFITKEVCNWRKSALLADLVVGHEFVLPSDNLMQILYPNGFNSQSVLQKLPPALSNCCADLMYTLSKLGVIPILCEKLITLSLDPVETDIRRNMAALWIQKIVLSCLKAREVKKVQSAIRDCLDYKNLTNHYQSLHLEASKSCILTSLAIAGVEDQRPDLKLGYTWMEFEVPGALTSLELVKKSVLQPSKFSCIFLPCLMELVYPPIPLQTRAQLLDLLNIYTQDGEKLAENKENITFSVNDLPSIVSYGVEGIKNSNSECDPTTNMKKKIPWSRCQDYFEWEKCPLGVLPWQSKEIRRALPKLLRIGEWKKSVPDNLIDSNDADNSTFSDVSSSLRRVKTGRVAKHTKDTTPAKLLKSWNQSPRQRALEFVTALYPKK